MYTRTHIINTTNAEEISQTKENGITHKLLHDARVKLFNENAYSHAHV